tara:strand:+ start:4382 stop:5533 length:1152 start_codon:yes stop_codon:yes gene_type:complete
MFNYYEGQNPWIASGADFNITSRISLDLAGTNNIALAGGLRDSGVEAGLQFFVPEVWGASIMDYMEKSLVFGALANDQSALVAGGGDRIHLPKHTELSASDTYGGATSAVETLIDTNLAFAKTSDSEDEYTLDINQAIHSAISITDVAKVQASFDVMNIYTSKLGYALAKKVDQYLSLKLFESIAFNYANGTDDGSQAGNTVELNTTHDSTDIIAAGVSNMLEAIYTNDSNASDYFMVLTPAVYASLFKLAEFAKYEGTGLAGDSNPLISGFAGKLGGVDVIVSNNFMHYGAGSTSSAQSASPVGNFSANGVTDESEKLLGYLIHKDAMHIAYSPGMKARVQSDYHLASLSTRFVADSVYGCLVTGSQTSGNKRVFALVSPAS